MNRKDFLKSVGLGTAGIAVSTTGLFAQNVNSTELKDLKGKTALVTGAARGIGLGIAVDFAKQGINVALLDIADPKGGMAIEGYRLANKSELDSATKEIQKLGVKAIGIQADVRNLEAMKKAVDKTISELGGLDIVVANAGVGIWSPFEDMNEKQWKDVIDVNLTGVANTVWASLPQLKKQKSGSVITLSSIGGRQGVPGVANYASTKWAIIGLTKTLSLELGKYNIRVNSIAPTAVNTPLYRSEGQYKSTGMSSFEDQDNAMMGYHSLPTPALDPVDIAQSATFLASDNSKFISGLVLDVAAGGNARYTG
ncbi:SDR family NAD(P)-dependent oxidoreductase [Winogradskyella maritima]|uniref:SDR family NAD(P)-dependent oxidoreductase n=1 Tax=Winogradskyella maritima TaxID=1517766 RepID=A0ABV8AF88_9FLAO|nr:SDR family NAD(P)-dependent oxidoreductase [Winogradskyella maritima]